MEFSTLFGIAVALAMDAFAVALGAGAVLDTLTGRHLFRLGFHFGLFQALMPILGWLAGLSIQRYIVAFDHWLALALLGFVGSHMIWEAFHPPEKKQASDPTRGLTLVMLSVATSIDALAVGLTLAMLGLDIWKPAVLIGAVAGLFTVGGMLLGRRVGQYWGQRVEIFGGLVLWSIGLKIVFDHTLGQ